MRNAANGKVLEAASRIKSRGKNCYSWKMLRCLCFSSDCLFAWLLSVVLCLSLSLLLSFPFPFKFYSRLFVFQIWANSNCAQAAVVALAATNANWLTWRDYYPYFMTHCSECDDEKKHQTNKCVSCGNMALVQAHSHVLYEYFYESTHHTVCICTSERDSKHRMWAVIPSRGTNAF